MRNYKTAFSESLEKRALQQWLSFSREIERITSIRLSADFIKLNLGLHQGYVAPYRVIQIL